MKINYTLLALASATLGLTACGGGGSTSASTPNNITNSPPVQQSSLVTAVAQASYSGDQAAAYNLLNTVRSQCGAGLLSQNASLDQSSAAHSLYEVTNGSQSGHNEQPDKPYYTGATPQDRATAAGYLGTAGEGMWIGDSGADAMQGLLSGPYHAIGMFNTWRDVGISYRLWTTPLSNGGVSTTHTIVVDLGTPKAAGPQLLGSSDVVTYPCEGSTGVRRLLMGESPNPAGSRDIASNPVGTPIIVMIRQGTLELSGGTLTKSDGTVVPLLPPVTQATDPNKGYLASNTGFILPDKILDPDSQYTAVVNGTNNGTPFTKKFTFTTGRYCPITFPCK